MNCIQTQLTRGILFFLLFASVTGSAQSQRTELQGEVLVGGQRETAITVYNRTSQKGTITDANGRFTIAVQSRDTLYISGLRVEEKNIIITQELIALRFLPVELQEKVIALDEVYIRPYGLSGDIRLDVDNVPTRVITASTLGIPTPQRSMSETERKIYNLKNDGGMVNGVINAISGRAKKNKKAIQAILERERVKKVRAFYSDKKIINTLHLTEPEIDEFIYYCQYDPEFVALVDTNDMLRAWSYMIDKKDVYGKE